METNTMAAVKAVEEPKTELKAVEEPKPKAEEEIPVTGPNVRAALKEPLDGCKLILNRTGGLDLMRGPGRGDSIWHTFALRRKKDSGVISRTKTVQEVAAEVDTFLATQKSNAEAHQAIQEREKREATEKDNEQLMAAVTLFQKHPYSLTLAPTGRAVRVKLGDLELAIYQLHGKPGRWNVDAINRAGNLHREPGIDEAAVAELLKRLA